MSDQVYWRIRRADGKYYCAMADWWTPLAYQASPFSIRKHAFAYRPKDDPTARVVRVTVRRVKRDPFIAGILDEVRECAEEVQRARGGRKGRKST